MAATVNVWDELHLAGWAKTVYPYDHVVSFLFRHRPSDLRHQPHEVHVLEVGCGTGNNLWVVLREEHHAYGIDASPTAIEAARWRFALDGMHADLRVGDFTALPWDDQMFHLVIDRQAITCASEADARAAVAEARRVLKPGGRFLFNPVANDHTSALDRARGTHAGAFPLRFYSRDDVYDLLAGWTVIECSHVAIEAMDGSKHTEWRVVAG